MRETLAIARRELSAYFATPVGWLCLAGWVVITGFFFAVMITGYAMEAQPASPYGGEQYDINDYLIPPFFGNTHVILLFVCPALSMRMFAEDRRQRSLELLLSSPISTAQIVLGKYLGALAFVAVMMASTLHYVAILYWLGTPDPGVLASSLGVTFLLAASFMAVGMLTSAFTESQVVALILSFGLLLLLWVLSWIDSFASVRALEIISELSVLKHVEQLLKGVLHLKDVAYFLTFIAFFLFGTYQRVEAFRWQ